MKVLTSACLVGCNVRWNGANKKSETLISWAESVGIDLVPICPENIVLGTPRSPIRLAQTDGRIAAVVNGTDILGNLKETCKALQNEHADALGFIGIEKSPTCGMSVGVRGLGKTIKGVFHQDAPFPTTTVNQLRNENNREAFLCRIEKYKNSLN